MSKPASLASGMIFCLNGVRPPSAKAPMITFLPAVLAATGRPNAVRAVEASARPIPPLSTERRVSLLMLDCVISLSITVDPMDGRQAGGIEEACIRHIESEPDVGAHRAPEVAACTDRNIAAADADIDQGLVAHRFDDIDLAGQRGPGAGCRNTHVFRPQSD